MAYYHEKQKKTNLRHVRGFIERRRTVTEDPGWVLKLKAKKNGVSKNTVLMSKKKKKTKKTRKRSNSLWNLKKNVSSSPTDKSRNISYIDSCIDLRLRHNSSRQSKDKSLFSRPLSSDNIFRGDAEEMMPMEYTCDSIPRSSMSPTPSETHILKHRTESDSQLGSAEEAKNQRSVPDENPLKLSMAHSEVRPESLFRFTKSSFDKPDKRFSLILPLSNPVKPRDNELELFPSTGDNTLDRALISEVLKAPLADLGAILRRFGVKPKEQKKTLIKINSTPNLLETRVSHIRRGKIEFLNEAKVPPEINLSPLLNSKSLSFNFSSLDFIDEKYEVNLTSKTNCPASDESDSWEDAKADSCEKTTVKRSATAPTTCLRKVVEGLESPSPSDSYEECKQWDNKLASEDKQNLTASLIEKLCLSDYDDPYARKDEDITNPVGSIVSKRMGSINTENHTAESKDLGKVDCVEAVDTSVISSAEKNTTTSRDTLNSPLNTSAMKDIGIDHNRESITFRTRLTENCNSMKSSMTHRTSRTQSRSRGSSVASAITHRSSKFVNASSVENSSILEKNIPLLSGLSQESPRRLNINSSSTPLPTSIGNHSFSVQRNSVIATTPRSIPMLKEDYEISSAGWVNISPDSQSLQDDFGKENATESLSGHKSDIQQNFAAQKFVATCEAQNIDKQSPGGNCLSDSNRELRQIRMGTSYPFPWDSSAAGRGLSPIYAPESKYWSFSDRVAEFRDYPRSQSLPGQRRIAERAANFQSVSATPSPKLRTCIQPQSKLSTSTPPPSFAKMRGREDSPFSVKDATSDSTSTARQAHANARNELLRNSPQYFAPAMFPYTCSPDHQLHESPHERFRSKSLGNQASMKVFIRPDQTTNVEYIF
jgi:hypothetical protein